MLNFHCFASQKSSFVLQLYKESVSLLLAPNITSRLLTFVFTVLTSFSNKYNARYFSSTFTFYIYIYIVVEYVDSLSVIFSCALWSFSIHVFSRSDNSLIAKVLFYIYQESVIPLPQCPSVSRWLSNDKLINYQWLYQWLLYTFTERERKRDRWSSIANYRSPWCANPVALYGNVESWFVNCTIL